MSFWDGMGAAIMSPIGSVVSGLFGNYQQNQANKANMALAEYKFDRDLEMWNKENEYNTPANQMKRFMQAGLNPNLMYGQGNSGNASSAPQFDAPEIKKYQDFGDFGLGKAADAWLRGQQLSQQKEQIESQKELNDATINEKNANALRTQQERLFTMEKTFGERKRNGFIDEQLEAQIAEARKRIDNLQSEIDTRAKQREVMDSQVGLNKSSQALNEENVNLVKARVRNLDADTIYKLTGVRVQQAQIPVLHATFDKIVQEAKNAGFTGEQLQYILKSNPSAADMRVLTEREQRAVTRIKEKEADLKEELGFGERISEIWKNILPW